MDTPTKALNVARCAAGVSFALAIGSGEEVAKWIKVGGVSVIFGRMPAAIEAAELLAAIIVGMIAYLRPAIWPTVLVLALLGVDVAYHAMTRGFDMTIVLDLAFAPFAAISFAGVRRYAELHADAARVNRA